MVMTHFHYLSNFQLFSLRVVVPPSRFRLQQKQLGSLL